VCEEGQHKEIDQKIITLPNRNKQLYKSAHNKLEWQGRNRSTLERTASGAQERDTCSLLIAEYMSGVAQFTTDCSQMRCGAGKAASVEQPKSNRVSTNDATSDWMTGCHCLLISIRL